MNKSKIRFAILKETYEENFPPGMTEEQFNNLNLGFSHEQFVAQVRFLSEERYITKPAYADDTISEYSCRLTEKGERYYEENKWYNKGYKGLKELRDWIKL